MAWHQSNLSFAAKRVADAEWHDIALFRNCRPSFHSPIPIPERMVRAQGFTLLEMLAVIVLISIAAAAVSISVTHGLASARVRAASTNLAAALRYTRTQAIVHAEPKVLTLDVDARSYTVPGRPAHPLPEHMRLSVTSAAEDQRPGKLARIRFFPDGSSTGGHVVLSRGARQWRVNVAWLTGAVSVESGKTETGTQP